MSSTNNDPPNTTSSPAWLTLYYVFFVISLVLVLLRCYVRVRLVRNWGWDDLFIIVALLCLLAGLILIQIEDTYGLGRHAQYIEPQSNIYQVLRFNIFFIFCDVLCCLFTKISISIFILRIKNTRKLRWVLFVLMVLMTLATLQVIIVICLACRPMRKIWTPSLQGSCMNAYDALITARVQSAFTIFTDLCLTISPIVILWKVQCNRKDKIKICLLMSLGLIATIANALRNFWQSDMEAPDFTYKMTPITVLAIVEMTSGVIAACVPACMPFFRTYGPRLSPKVSTWGTKSGITSFQSRHSYRAEQIQDLRSMSSASTEPEVEHKKEQVAEKVHSPVWLFHWKKVNLGKLGNIARSEKEPALP